MSTEIPNRPCGRCGAPVVASSDMCPRCGALLAAYEAPRGSSSVSEVIAQAPAMPADRIAPLTTTPEKPPHPRATAPRTAVTTTREPDPATTAAHTDLVSVMNNRQERIEAAKTATRTDLVSVLKGREAALQSPIDVKPRATGRRPHPAPPRETRTRQQPPAPATPLSARQTASMAASFGKLALGVLMILVFLGILDFNLVPILVLGVVMLSLLGIMRSAAKASGRKTTTMYDPKRRDSRRR